MHYSLLLMLMALLLVPLHSSAADAPGKAAMENGKKASSTVIPVPIAKSFLEGKGLILDKPEEYDSYTDSEGKVRAPSYSHVSHTGKIQVLVIEAGPGKVRIEGLPFDEFVHILEGRLILTLDDGQEFTFETGDSFTLPEGYVGYWDMPEKYRELVVINTK